MAIPGVYILIDDAGSFIGWMTVITFGVFAGLFHLRTIVRPPRLRLTIIGFDMSGAIWSHSYAWTDVSRFEVVNLGIGRFMGQEIIFSEHNNPKKILGNTYSVNSEALAEMMNAFRARAMKTDAWKQKYQG